MKTLLAASLSLLTSLQLFSASFSTNSTADAFVTTGPSGNLSGNNYGAAGGISIAATGLPQGEFQTVVRFNLGGALGSFDSMFGSGQWSIQSVTLQLTATLGNNPIFNTPASGQFGISWMQNDSWAEGSGGPSAPGASGITLTTLQNTFISAADQSLGTFSFNGATSGAFTYSLALTPGLAADVFAGDNLSLRLFAADSSMSGVFNSRNVATAANRPLLAIVAVPEPGTMRLGGLGLAILAGWKLAFRRKGS